MKSFCSTCECLSSNLLKKYNLFSWQIILLILKINIIKRNKIILSFKMTKLYLSLKIFVVFSFNYYLLRVDESRWWESMA